MNYYSFHIGDYRRDTSHLSLLEHGVYRQLLDWLYLDQRPITSETETVFRRLSARTEDEKNAVLIVLKEFFVLRNDGYVQDRVLHEINEYEAKADRARQAGKLGGRPKKTDEVISGLSKETDGKANHKPLTINQEPLSKEVTKVTSKKIGSRIPHDYFPDENSHSFCCGERSDLIFTDVLDEFRDYWKSVAGAKGVKLDWDATFRNWVRNAKPKHRQGAPQFQSAHERQAAKAKAMQDENRRISELI